VDGQPPFSDQSLIGLRTGTSTLVFLEDAAVAIVSPGEAELVVHPDARGTGLGTGLLNKLIASSTGDLKVWAHGDHPAARALAASHGFTADRRLLQLRIAVPLGKPSSVDSFRLGSDDAEWLRINSLAFAFHDEQGAVSQRDLNELKTENWFDAEDFLVIRDGENLIGFCWLKIENDSASTETAGSLETVGEFYVVGVDPARQREGLGRRLMDAGFARLEARGIHTAALYVEADNVAAVSLYRSLGFTDHTVDVQYALHR
jgi:mycothiol synthase